MADQPVNKTLLPSLVPQNPAPFEQDSQGRKNVVRSQVDRIMEVFLQVLPSNYVSQVSGPFYTIQLQSIAERIADFQITAQEVMADSVFDYTRSEVLYQIIGALVFPDASTTGYPDLEGDLTYRTFLKRMVTLLLQGATAATMKSGVELLTDATVEIVERGVQARKNPGSAWGPDDMFTFEVNVSAENVTEIANEIISSEIAFSDNGLSADTITSSTVDFWDLGIRENQSLTVSGSAFNNGVYTVSSVTSGVITLIIDDVLNDEIAGASVTLNFNSVVSTDIAFANNGIISSQTIDFLASGFEDNQRITVSGSINNNGTYTIVSATSGALTLKSTDKLLQENAGSSVTLSIVSNVVEAFPTDPLILQQNVAIVLRALKPAHTLYEYRQLFHEVFSPLFSDTLTFDLDIDYYQDLRRYWQGAVEITGTGGITLTDKSLFSDPTRDFSSIIPGAELTILSGVNAIQATSTTEGYKGHFRVTEVLYFPVGDDATPQAYTSSPTGLIGTATVTEDVLEDPLQDWSNAVDGEIVTLTAGSNAGSYRLKTLVGLNGGPIGKAVGPATMVRVAPSLLRLRTRMSVAATGQSYKVSVDRLGVQVPRLASNEDVGPAFLGVAPATNDTFFTLNGPLVKPWGDWTPATLSDVTVLVGGAPVSVKEINPYTGKVILTVPVVLSFTPDVVVSYWWFHMPVMGMAGLNTEGLVLNKWNRIPGQDPLTAGSHGYQVQDPTHPKGAGECTSRFAMGVVLGGNGYKQEAMLIGHRYLGFEKEYTASLNNPNSLRLNQSPHASSVEVLELAPTGVSVAYDGTQGPQAATPAWSLLGVDTGAVDINAGTYTLVDAQVGSYAPTDPPVAVYYKDEDFSFPATVSMIGRFQIEDAASLLKSTNTDILYSDGVFTGVGFGFNNERYLYLVGALLVNGVEHVGILKDTNKISLASGWSIGPEVTGTILTVSTIEVPTATSPQDLKIGSRFQILTGTQTGIYTATSVVVQTTGVTTLTVTPAFPTILINKYGNKYPQVFFETPWSEALATYRLVVSTRQKLARLTVSGLATATVVEASGTSVPLPAQSSLALFSQPTGTKAFWGSLSYEACSRTKWSFFRYGVVPDDAFVRQHVKAVNAEMTVLPENDVFYEWTTTQNFGYSKLEAGGLLLKSTSTNDNLDLSYAYTKAEPMFVRNTNMDCRATFRVDTGVLGAGDAGLVLNDGIREIRLGTIFSYEDVNQNPYRQLVQMPHATLAGIWDAPSQGWTLYGGTGTAICHESDLVTTQTAGQTIRYSQNLVGLGSAYIDPAAIVMEARFAVDSHTPDPGAGFTGIGFGSEVGPTSYVGVRLRGSLILGLARAVQLVDIIGTVVRDYVFDWDDGEFHSYRVVVSGGATVSLFVDDDFIAPAEALGNFPGGGGTWLCQFGARNVPYANATSVIRWRSVGFAAMPSTVAGVHRTLGIFRGSNLNDINDWALPRTDATSALNSDRTGPVIEEMDWTSDLEVRLLRDPRWGVTLYMPLMAPPPTTPDFFSEIADPGAGWINVQYSQLPYVSVQSSTPNYIEKAATGTIRANSTAHGDEVTIKSVPFTCVEKFATGTVKCVNSSAGAGVFTLDGTAFNCVENAATGTAQMQAVTAGTTITFSGSLGSVFFTASATEDVAAREFDQSGTDIQCATSLCNCINDPINQVWLAAINIGGVAFSADNTGGTTDTVIFTATSPGIRGDWKTSASVSTEIILAPSGATLTHVGENNPSTGTVQMLGVNLATTLTFTGFVGPLVFTAAAAENISAQEFDRSGTDIQCATSLCNCINEYNNQLLLEACNQGASFTATNAGTNTVTLTATVPGIPGDWWGVLASVPAEIVFLSAQMTHIDANSAIGEFNSFDHLYTDDAVAQSLAAAVWASPVWAVATSALNTTTISTIFTRGLGGQFTMATTAPTEFILSGDTMICPPADPEAQEFLGALQVVGGTDIEIATSLVSAINNSASQSLIATAAPVDALCVASNGGIGTSDIVTLTAMTPGVTGDFALTENTSGARIVISGENMVHTNAVPLKFSTAMGFVSFGAPDKRSFTQQHWSWVRYRLFKPVTDDYIAPQHMVLNWANTISSGDRNLGYDLETVAIQTLDTRRVSLKPTHLYASSIYKVVDGSTIYTQEMFTFDSFSQTITLGQDSLGADLTFSGVHVPVTVLFIAGNPVTTTYLLNVPLLDSALLLNEGTPPFPKNQQPSTSVIGILAITNVDIIGNTFTIPGNYSAILVTGDLLTVSGTGPLPNNDGIYTTLSWSVVAGDTVIVVSESIPFAVVAGNLSWARIITASLIGPLAITDVDLIGNTFMVSGDYASKLVTGDLLTVSGTGPLPNNNGIYTTLSWSVVAGNTIIVVFEVIPFAVVDGSLSWSRVIGAPTGPGDDKTYQAAVGTAGVLNVAGTLADPADLSDVLPGYELRVLSGTGTGIYSVVSVAGHVMLINPAPPINETGVTWEVWGGFDLGSPAGNIVTFTDDPESLYASMQFFEVNNSGYLGLIATPYDGEPWGMDISGPMVWQPIPVPQFVAKSNDQLGGLPGKLLFASGGNYMGPVVDGSGNIINMAPLGGTLGPGTSVLYPCGSRSMVQTEWFYSDLWNDTLTNVHIDSITFDLTDLAGDPLIPPISWHSP